MLRFPTRLTCRGLTILSAALAASCFDLQPAIAAPDTQPTSAASETLSPVARATNDAVARLYRETRKEPVFRDIDAGDLIDALDVEPDVLATIRHARQIGAPRAISENAVQVHMEINGSQISQILVSSAAAKPDQSPLAAKRLQSLLSNWDQKTFTAVGSSLGEFANGQNPGNRTSRSTMRGGEGTFEPELSRSMSVEGDEGTVPDDQLAQLESAARHDAAERFVQRLENDPKISELGLHQLLEDQSTRNVLIEQIALSKAEVVDASQRSLRVELQLDSAAIVNELEKIVGSSAPENLAEVVATHAPTAVGFASAPNADLSSFPAPAWAADPVGTEATSAAVGTPLQTARAAERSARTALAAKILILPVDDTHTILDVMMEDEVIRLRLETLVQDAPLAGIDYEAEGQVRVRISVDGSQIWAALVAD